LSSVQARIRELIAGIDDPANRMEVARTITFLYEVFSSGEREDKEIRDSLFEVVCDTLAFKNPMSSMEEVREMAGPVTDEFMRLFRVSAGFARAVRRSRWTPL